MITDEITKLGQRIAFNKKKQGLYIMRASKQSYQSYIEVLTK